MDFGLLSYLFVDMLGSRWQKRPAAISGIKLPINNASKTVHMYDANEIGRWLEPNPSKMFNFISFYNATPTQYIKIDWILYFVAFNLPKSPALFQSILLQNL